MRIKTIADLKKDRHRWVTVVAAEFYPDYMGRAIAFYRSVLERFRELVNQAKDSAALFRAIGREPTRIRTQLQRVFRKYVSPDTPVEMLKVKGDEEKIIQNFGDLFRPIEEVHTALKTRPFPDEALVALLWEYKTRGLKGYELTEWFFAWFREKHGERFTIEGPERAGPDVPLKSVFPDYPLDTTVDFVIWSRKGAPLVVGYGRYDSDRGGAQGLDRISSYSDKVTEILGYAEERRLPLKLLFVNDGPGLLLGRLWDRYAALEEKGQGRVIVATRKMLDVRVTEEWLLS